MRSAAKEFADDPCASAKRATMVRAARALLSSVTRLLCVADMADVYRLLASLKLVSKVCLLSSVFYCALFQVIKKQTLKRLVSNNKKLNFLSKLKATLGVNSKHCSFIVDNLFFLFRETVVGN